MLAPHYFVGYLHTSFKVNTILFVTTTTGNASDFGDLTLARQSQWLHLMVTDINNEIPEGAIRFNTDSNKMEVMLVING